jgi:large conductance mechanosensitive channel
VLKGFKDFLLRGNVIYLAVGVIIGVAFNGVVTALVNNLFNPLIAAFGGEREIGLAVQIVKNNPKTVLDFGAIVTALINLLVVAAVLYFLIVAPIKKLEERRKRGEEPPADQPTDVELLTEIRDLLRDERQPQNR